MHSKLLQTTTVKDLAELFPERFNNKTNGVSPRRWLLLANPDLGSLITSAIGERWVTDLSLLSRLTGLCDDKSFQNHFLHVKREAKCRFSDWLRSSLGQIVDPDTIFDSQVKRIHEYKRQLLNVLRIVVLYNRFRVNRQAEGPARTFLFAGKAAPSYKLAKLIIKLINSVAAKIDCDPELQQHLKIVFVPDYSVSVAEHLIPASDISNQISTAGYEASGTSNMKFMGSSCFSLTGAIALTASH